MINSYSFLTIGKTQESKEAVVFKRYVGVGSSYVIAVNPTKKELEAIYGREMKEPEYVGSTDNGEEAHVTFIVKTAPETNNGIEIINRVMFTLRKAPAYNRDQTKVQVIDKFGNTTWAVTEDAKAGKKLLSANGNPMKIDDKYRIAGVGEAELVNFLKVYLGVEDVFNYIDGSWVKKDNENDYLFGLEKVANYFKGDFSEIKDAIALQPNNKVKLLYGVRTTPEGKEYQTVATRLNMVLRNNAGSKAYEKLQNELSNLKAQGSFPTTVFSNKGNTIKDLEEYVITPTNLDTPASTDSDSEAMPWD